METLNTKIPVFTESLDITFNNVQYNGTVTSGSVFIPQSNGKTLTITSITIQGYSKVSTDLVSVYASRGDFKTFITSDSMIQQYGATIAFTLT